LSSRHLRVLFVRPADRDGLDELVRFAVPREVAGELPVPLLRLASATKLGSPHRVFVHDARQAVGGAENSLRSVAALHRPDVSVVWLHPALMADGLEAARAVRHSGSPLVIGAGPLVDLWPEGARRLPELDGLLPGGGEAGLLEALDRLAAGDDARGLSEALSLPPGPPPDGPEPVDRKLLDYATYQLVGPDWPPERPGVTRPDKGRWAASRIPLHDAAGRPLGPGEIIDDMARCDLLGIPWQALGPTPGLPPLDLGFWDDLLEVLRLVPGGRDARRLRLALSPRVARRSSLTDLASLNVVAIDLGTVHAGDVDAVEEARVAGRAALRADLQVSVTVLLDQPGYSLQEEAVGLDCLRGAGLGVRAALEARIGTVDPHAWMVQLEAPTGRFVPPGIDPARLELARRVHRVQAARRERPGEREGLVARVRKLMPSR
jgi:hypothetical protein